MRVSNGGRRRLSKMAMAKAAGGSNGSGVLEEPKTKRTGIAPAAEDSKDRGQSGQVSRSGGSGKNCREQNTARGTHRRRPAGMAAA